MVRISDIELLKVLMRDARRKYVDIAKELGVSEAAVRKRIKKLEKEGVIKGYEADIDLRKLGYQIKALIGLDTEPQMYIRIVEQVKNMKEVWKAFTSTGDHMIMIEGWFKSYEELSKFIKALESLEGVTRVCPAIILERVR